MRRHVRPRARGQRRHAPSGYAAARVVGCFLQVTIVAKRAVRRASFTVGHIRWAGRLRLKGEPHSTGNASR